MPRDDTPANDAPDPSIGSPDEAGSAGRTGRTRPKTRVPVRSRLTATPRARRLGGVLTAVVLVAAGGGLVAATALTPQGSGSSRPIVAPLAAVPAGSSVGVCPGPARLLEGAPVGTDPQFSPESATAKTEVNALVLGSSAGVLPGSRLAALTGSTLVELAKSAAATESPAAAAPKPANSVPVAGVVSQRGVWLV